MKRWLFLLSTAMLLMLITACGGQAEVPPTAVAPLPTLENTAAAPPTTAPAATATLPPPPTIAAAATNTPAATPEATGLNLLTAEDFGTDRNPLTGELVETAVGHQNFQRAAQLCAPPSGAKQRRLGV